MRLLILCTLWMCWPIFSPAIAQSIAVSVGELERAISNSSTGTDSIEALAVSALQAQLANADLKFDAGELLYTDSQSNLTAESGCTRTEIRNVDLSIRLASESGLEFTLQSINDPIHLAVQLDASINATGRAKQVLGFRLGSCQDLANDNFSFSARGDSSVNLDLSIELQPRLDALAQRITFSPAISIEGGLVNNGIHVDVDDSLLRVVLEELLEELIEDALDTGEILQSIQSLESSLQDTLDAEASDGNFAIDLPSPSDPQVAKLYELLSPGGDFMLSRGYINAQRVELLAALLLGDEEAVKDLLGLALQCEAAGILQVELPHSSVYELTNAGCEATQIPNADLSSVPQASNFYYDAQCLQPLDYFPTRTIEYCDAVLDTNRLGNAASNVDELNRWTLSPGTQFDIGALNFGDKNQPFTQRVEYKSVSTAMGTCSLEMRIHHPQPNSYPAENSAVTRRAVLALHGGSWQRRSSGALGIESVATQFTNEGYVVFAPFYRLLGNAEGTEACNNATLDAAISDVNDALDWVQDNAADYGAGGPPVLFGQSAGGHLAGVLAVERPLDVASAVLFYAPTDFTDFAQQLIDGRVDSSAGKRILEVVVGQTLETLDLSSPIIQRNTLTQQILAESIDTPPFFLLHGQLDTVLPFSQSVRFCNTLAGDADSGPASSLANDDLRNIVRCGNGVSELHLIKEGEHALDLCIAEELCLAGSPASAQLTSDSMNQMLAWTKTAHVLNNPLDDEPASGSSGGASLSGHGIWLLLVLVVMRAHRYLIGNQKFLVERS